MRFPRDPHPRDAAPPSRWYFWFVLTLLVGLVWLVGNRLWSGSRAADTVPRTVTPRGNLAADEQATIELFNLKGKTALVTGGSRGLGLQMALALGELGAKVVVTSRNPDKGLAALAEIRQAAGSEAVSCMRLDLASLADVRRFAAEFLQAHPRLDVLVLNAGLVLAKRSETVDGFESTFGVKDGS